MLWNEVFNFFVRFVFGGIDSEYNEYLGFLGFDSHDSDSKFGTNLVEITFNNWSNTLNEEPFYMPLGNYLSLIATIITMVAIILFMCFLIKKIIGIIFRLFTGSSAF